MDDALAANLQEEFHDPPHINIVHGSAFNAPDILHNQGLSNPHHIYSSIPITILRRDKRLEYLEILRDILDADGEYTSFIVRDAWCDLRKVFPFISPREYADHWTIVQRIVILRAWKSRDPHRKFLLENGKK